MPTAVQNVTNTVVNYFNRPQSSPDKDFGLTTLRGILTTGAGAIFICASFAETAHGFWHVSGLSLIVALAALICGGFLGFLFGIPRSLDKNEAGATRSFGTNTNLEQISDWLTKIIVGVSLTQLPAIQRHLDVLTTKIATGFGKYLGPEYAYPYSGALLAFFSICGFLYVYLWCMLYLLQQVNNTSIKEYVNQVAADVKDEIKTEAADIFEIEKVRKQIEEFNQQRNKIIIEESSEAFKGIIEKAKPGPVTVLNDCQKNRWGSVRENDSFEVNAAFENNTLDEDNSFLVTLTISPKPGKETPFKTAYFFLHDTYSPGCIKKVIAEAGKASLKIPSYEAFTVGVYIEDADTKLELDLNEYPGTPPEYTFDEVLPTIDELRTKEKQLKEKPASPGR